MRYEREDEEVMLRRKEERKKWAARYPFIAIVKQEVYFLTQGHGERMYWSCQKEGERG